jgi:CheY-like chemotaxis protein
MAHERGLKVLLATTAAEGLRLLQRYRADVIWLDIRLPDRSGWSVLDRLKHDPATRHIPVRVVTIVDDVARGFRLGARAVLRKPAPPETLEAALDDLVRFISRERRNLLVVEPNERERKRLVELLSLDGVDVTAVGSAEEALAPGAPPDCVLLDADIDDMAAVQFVARLRSIPGRANVPVVVWARQGGLAPSLDDLGAVADVIDARQPDADLVLIERATLYLHVDEATLPGPVRAELQHRRTEDPVFAGKRVLVVDDEEDVQLLVSRILRDAGYQVDTAGEGGEAIEKLRAARPDLIILDLMMPGIDGWGVLEHLHGHPNPPPVVIVTARADYPTFTRGVREGAVAFIAKPFRFHELVATCQKLLLQGALEAGAGAERRRDPRRTLMVEVKVLSRDRAPIALGELVNLSNGGAQVDLGVPLEIGDSVRVAFHIPGGGPPFSVEGQVRWRSSTAQGFSHGLLFQNLTKDEGRQLLELLGPK